MSGNSFGQNFVVTTCGESHGAALLAIVDGCPPGLSLTEADIQFELDRRRPGSSRYTTQRQESDQIQILSGVFAGKTTGTSIGLMITNQDQRSRDYDKIKENDTFDITGLTEFTPGKPLTIVINHEEQVKEEILVNHTYNEQQIQWFKAGGSLNVIRSEVAGK